MKGDVSLELQVLRRVDRSCSPHEKEDIYFRYILLSTVARLQPRSVFELLTLMSLPIND